jgi:hypothetical protein
MAPVRATTSATGLSWGEAFLDTEVSRIHLEWPDSRLPEVLVAADVLLRQESDEEEEEDDRQKEDDVDDDETDDGYSE